MLDHNELTALAGVMVCTLACGLFLLRFKQPAVIGYILAGIILGPSGFGLIQNRENVSELAELGVLLLLFLIGMELSLRDFARVWRVAMLTMLLQISVSLGVVFVLGRLLDWPLAAILLVGFAMSLSSTAVAVKTLEETGELKTNAGRIAVGVLIAQDLAVVPMLLIVGSLAGSGVEASTFVKIAFAIGFLAIFIKFLSGRRRLHLPFAQLIGARHDLTPLSALGYCFAAAAISGLLGLSPAYGAFLAGLFIGNSNERAAMHSATLPIQSLLLMVFFLSVGLLIDLEFIWANLGLVATLLIFVTVLKTAMNVSILHALGEPWQNSFLAGVVMAQIGEFSFVLGATAFGANLISPDGYRLLVAVIALSLIVSPFWLHIARLLHGMAYRNIPTLGELLEELYGLEAEVIAEGSDRIARLAYRIGRASRIILKKRGETQPPPERAAPRPDTGEAADTAMTAAENPAAGGIADNTPPRRTRRRRKPLGTTATPT
ncbi:MAG: cation/H(+) antiporter [Alphaproteobacteria bacterium]|nr:cation/H(+) antiporter [Alphaproteobacteria bacterium]